MYLRKYTREELIERVEPYLKKYDKILVTEDGQVFYEKAKSYANAHANSNGLKVLELSKDDLPKPKPGRPAKEAEKEQEVKKEVDKTIKTPK